MSFKYSPDDVSGMGAFRRFCEQCPTGGTSVQFEYAFTDIQHRPLRQRWALVARQLLPVTDPNNEPEAFLVCNAIRHIEPGREHPSGTDFYDWNRECVRNFEGQIPEHAYYRDFRHFAFAKVARMYPETVLAEFCRIVTEPHPKLAGKTSLTGGRSLFYSGLDC